MEVFFLSARTPNNYSTRRFSTVGSSGPPVDPCPHPLEGSTGAPLGSFKEMNPIRSSFIITFPSKPRWIKMFFFQKKKERVKRKKKRENIIACSDCVPAFDVAARYVTDLFVCFLGFFFFFFAVSFEQRSWWCGLSALWIALFFLLFFLCVCLCGLAAWPDSAIIGCRRDGRNKKKWTTKWNERGTKCNNDQKNWATKKEEEDGAPFYDGHFVLFLFVLFCFGAGCFHWPEREILFLFYYFFFSFGFPRNMRWSSVTTDNVVVPCWTRGRWLIFFCLFVCFFFVVCLLFLFLL